MRDNASLGVRVHIDRHTRIGGRNLDQQVRQPPGGNLQISATLTYGSLSPIKRGDTIANKSFVLCWAIDDEGEFVTMKTRVRPRQVIPAERGERAKFHPAKGALRTTYGYRVQWDTRGSRTRAAGEIETTERLKVCSVRSLV